MSPGMVRMTPPNWEALEHPNSLWGCISIEGPSEPKGLWFHCPLVALLSHHRGCFWALGRSSGKAGDAEPPPCLVPTSVMVEQHGSKVSIPLPGSGWVLPLQRGHLCRSKQKKTLQQSRIAAWIAFFIKKRGREKHQKSTPCPRKSYPCLGVLKTSWSWNQACAPQCIRRISAKTLTPCGFCKCLCISFSLWKGRWGNLPFQTFAWSLAIQSYQKIYY